MTRWIQAALCSSCLAIALAFPAHAHARGRGGVDGFMNGLNAVLTAIADPVVGFADPPAKYDSLPLHEVTGRILGFAEGTALGVYRAGTGVIDMVAAPLYVVPQITPKARFSLVIGDAGVSGSVGFAPDAPRSR
jgi:hypothetical protein